MGSGNRAGNATVPSGRKSWMCGRESRIEALHGQCDRLLVRIRHQEDGLQLDFFDGFPYQVTRVAPSLYHLLVLWAHRDLLPSEVWAALARREGISGVEEKKSRKI